MHRDDVIWISDHFSRCQWTVYLDLVFAMLKKCYTEAKFFSVDAEKCKVQFFPAKETHTWKLLTQSRFVLFPEHSHQIQRVCTPDICILQKGRAAAYGRDVHIQIVNIQKRVGLDHTCME